VCRNLSFLVFGFLLWHRRAMALEPKDLKAIRLLMEEVTEPLEQRLTGLESRMTELRDEMLSLFIAAEPTGSSSPKRKPSV